MNRIISTQFFDLNLVRTFVAIFETKSVTLAAERLGLTQPSISHALGKLRAAYDDRLFVRGPQGLVPTTAAVRIYETVCAPLSALENTVDSQDGFDPASSTKRFRIATSDIGALFFIPPLLRSFQRSAPNIQVEFVQLSKTVMDDLSIGALDFALGNLPDLQKHTQEASVFEERYVCLVDSKNPIAQEHIELWDFTAARHVMVTAPISGHELIEEALSLRGIRRNIVAIVPNFSVLPSVVAGSDLLAILPERVAKLFGSAGNLKIVEIPVQLPEFEVRLHWHTRVEASKSHQWLRQEILRTLRSL